MKDLVETTKIAERLLRKNEASRRVAEAAIDTHKFDLSGLNSAIRSVIGVDMPLSKHAANSTLLSDNFAQKVGNLGKLYSELWLDVQFFGKDISVAQGNVLLKWRMASDGRQSYAFIGQADMVNGKWAVKAGSVRK